jgi:hypothetical protein
VGRELGWTSPRNGPQIIGMLGDICMEEGDLSAACAYFEDSLAKRAPSAGAGVCLWHSFVSPTRRSSGAIWLGRARSW